MYCICSVWPYNLNGYNNIGICLFQQKLLNHTGFEDWFLVRLLQVDHNLLVSSFTESVQRNQPGNKNKALLLHVTVKSPISDSYASFRMDFYATHIYTHPSRRVSSFNGSCRDSRQITHPQNTIITCNIVSWCLNPTLVSFKNVICYFFVVAYAKGHVWNLLFHRNFNFTHSNYDNSNWVFPCPTCLISLGPEQTYWQNYFSLSCENSKSTAYRMMGKDWTSVKKYCDIIWTKSCAKIGFLIILLC